MMPESLLLMFLTHESKSNKWMRKQDKTKSTLAYHWKQSIFERKIRVAAFQIIQKRIFRCSVPDMRSFWVFNSCAELARLFGLASRGRTGLVKTSRDLILRQGFVNRNCTKSQDLFTREDEALLLSSSATSSATSSTFNYDLLWYDQVIAKNPYGLHWHKSKKTLPICSSRDWPRCSIHPL